MGETKINNIEAIKACIIRVITLLNVYSCMIKVSQWAAERPGRGGEGKPCGFPTAAITKTDFQLTAVQQPNV